MSTEKYILSRWREPSNRFGGGIGEFVNVGRQKNNDNGLKVLDYSLTVPCKEPMQK